jgi:hypothetical protein
MDVARAGKLLALEALGLKWFGCGQSRHTGFPLD